MPSAGWARPRDVAGNDASGLTNRTVAVLLGHTAYTVDEGDTLQVPSHWHGTIPAETPRRTTHGGFKQNRMRLQRTEHC